MRAAAPPSPSAAEPAAARRARVVASHLRAPRPPARPAAGDDAVYRAAYPLEGPPPPGEDTGLKLPDGAPLRRLAAVDTAAVARGAAAITARYEAERAKRQSARPKGMAHYRRLADLAREDPRFRRVIADPWIDAKWLSRAPVADHVEYAIIGGGYGGLLTAGRMRQAGISASDIRIVEKAGDVGGTWYWNRYPGAMCDVESYAYMPFCEELGVVPTEKYAHQPELMEHARQVMRFFGLYERALFGTMVSELRWDDGATRWVVRTDRGDVFTAAVAVINFGVFSQPKLPEGAPGVEAFGGRVIHTARWDYGYTGGSPLGGLSKLADKRVAIIGTGPTAVQAVPHLAEAAGHLYVFQRTPSSINVRNNFRTTAAFAAEFCAAPGWQRERIANFGACIETPAPGQVDLANDGWTWTVAKTVLGAREKRRADPGGLSVGAHMEVLDHVHMEQIRARVAAVVTDPRTAAALQPQYRPFCKRPCYHDEYLHAFNRRNVTLVDCPRGVEGFSPRGIVAGGVEYEVDCVVLGTGFETGLTINMVDAGDAGKKASANDYEVFGAGGLSLSEKWARGPRTYLSFHTRGFPNMFILNAPQGAIATNSVQNLSYVTDHIASHITAMRRGGLRRFEASAEAEAAYSQMLYDQSTRGQRFYQQCTPGWMNNEGQFVVGKTWNTSYPTAVAYGEMLAKMHAEGAVLRGLDVR